MSNIKSFSVSLLRESRIEEPIKDDRAKIFEESIVLMKQNEKFFQKMKRENL